MEKSEINIMRRIQLAAPKIGVTLFRNNVGVGLVGKIFRPATRTTVTVEPGDAVVFGARPLHSGLCVGSSDLIGFQKTIITNAHIGKTLAVFSVVEVKSESGKATPEQNKFLNAVSNSGGVSVLAYSVEDFNAAFRK